MPTPADRATASRLASAPPALKTAFAASSTRSRLRTASARGLRVVVPDGLMPIVYFPIVYFSRGPLKSGGSLRISGSRQGDTYHPRQANGERPGYPAPRGFPVAEVIGT